MSGGLPRSVASLNGGLGLIAIALKLEPVKAWPGRSKTQGPARRPALTGSCARRACIPQVVTKERSLSLAAFPAREVCL